MLLALAAVVSTNTGFVCTYSSVSISAAGDISVACTSGPTPTPSPSPTPTPGPTPTPLPLPPTGQCWRASGLVLQPMFVGGTNNYVFDSFKYRNPSISPGINASQGSVQVFELPKSWLDGAAITSASVAFAPFIFYSPPATRYEVAFSRCAGDFEYYKNAPVVFGGSTFYPCGGVFPADFVLNWNIGASTLASCGIPQGETWYMSWRVVPGTCPADTGSTCGGVFYIPR